MEDDKILTEKQTKQVTGGDGIVIINPGSLLPDVLNVAQLM